MKKALYTIIIIVLIIGIALVVARKHYYLGCYVSGGEWKKVGIAGTKQCIYTYSDAGKSCLSSDECKGDCILVDFLSDDGAAVCEQDSDVFGCYRTIEDFKAGIPGMCWD